MVAERRRGEGGRGDGGGGRRRRRRRRVPALVAPTEGGGHRDPGAAAEGGREKDERAESLSSPTRAPGRPRRWREERAGAPGSAAEPRPGSERGAERSCAASTDHSKWQRLSHTGAALPAPRDSALPARTKRSGSPGGKQNLVLQAGRLSDNFTSHRHSLCGE